MGTPHDHRFLLRGLTCCRSAGPQKELQDTYVQNWVLQQAEIDSASYARPEDLESIASGSNRTEERPKDVELLPPAQLNDVAPASNIQPSPLTSESATSGHKDSAPHDPEVLVGIDFGEESKLA